ncbi:unnamed protein product [Dicrocoelium dendriticum]|nr:unnamed protein product [Dicrocoelium dendriticum]
MERRLHSIRSLRSLDLLNSRRNEKDTFNDLASDEIKSLCAPFYLEQSSLEKFMNLMHEQVEIGLQDEEVTHDLKLLNTFVNEIPKRKISGDYLCLDFKGRYYRMVLIRMSKDIDKTGIDETLYTIPKKVRLQSGSSVSCYIFISPLVFKYIAETVLDFLSLRGLQDNEYDLAFCFGFPVELVSLSQAYLLGWTKEFSCEAVVGQDVCNLFQKNLNALDLKVKVKAIFNDTVGVLAACALRDAECRIGIIVSAGTNCCYYEKVSNIGRPFASLCQGNEVIINTEWGAFGDMGCLNEFLTEYDIEVSRNTLSPGKQT